MLVDKLSVAPKNVVFSDKAQPRQSHDVRWRIEVRGVGGVSSLWTTPNLNLKFEIEMKNEL